MNKSTGTSARHLQEELAALRELLLRMASRAEDLLEVAVEALDEKDNAKARSVIVGDEELDALELQIDDACINLLALQQPLASDLRLIIMTMRVSNDLERIGDHAVNIAEAAIRLSTSPRIQRLRELDEMIRLSRIMVSDALDSFMRRDSAAAREVRVRDDQVDSLRDSLFRIMLTHMMEEPRLVGTATSLILVSGNLERIADLATNIAEDVIYLVEGLTVKHDRKGKPAHDESAH